MMEMPPIPTISTRLIAQRNLVFATKTRRRRIQVRIGEPVRDVPTAGGLDWRCPVSITGSPKQRRLRGLGVDSLQALIDALKLIEIELHTRERKEKGRFVWLGESWRGVPAIDLAPLSKTRPNRRLQPTKAFQRPTKKRKAAARLRS